MKRLLPKTVGLMFNTLDYMNPALSGKFAFNLFCRPRSGRLTPEDKTYLAQSDVQKDYDCSFGSVQTYTWNPKGNTKVFLLHGWESNAARWEPLIAQLTKDGYAVTAIDAPAHGASAARTFTMIRYAEAVDVVSQDLNPHKVIGHSLGGGTLCYYMAHYQQDFVNQVVLLGVPATLRQMLETYSGILSLSERTNQSIDAFCAHRFGNPIDYYSTVEFAKKIKVPALIVHDCQDPIVPVSDSKLYKQSIGESKLIYTENLGHSLQGEVVYRSIIDFLK